jgi:hypothetical protein
VQESESHQKYIQTGVRSKEYLTKRAQGKTLVKLKTLHPELTYEADEVTYQGAFQMITQANFIRKMPVVKCCRWAYKNCMTTRSHLQPATLHILTL